MRIWDVPVRKLCRKHLLGEHNELHSIWSIITKGKKGFSKHPETMRWRGKLKALYKRHEQEVREMERRGYKHCSSLDKRLATGNPVQDVRLQSLKEQKIILKTKRCRCNV